MSYRDERDALRELAESHRRELDRAEEEVTRLQAQNEQLRQELETARKQAEAQQQRADRLAHKADGGERSPGSGNKLWVLSGMFMGLVLVGAISAFFVLRSSSEPPAREVAVAPSRPVSVKPPPRPALPKPPPRTRRAPTAPVDLLLRNELYGYASIACHGMVACFKKHEAFGQIAALVKMSVDSRGKVKAVKALLRNAGKKVRRCVEAAGLAKQLSNFDGPPGQLVCSFAGTIVEGTEMLSISQKYVVRQEGLTLEKTD